VPTCKVEVATSCVGTMASKVSNASDTRNIKFNLNGTLTNFTYSALPGSLKQYFESAYLSTRLTQWPNYTSGTNSQQTKAVGSGIVNFLRGQKGLEDRSSNAAEDRLFRYRETTLSDITESQPAFIAAPRFNYIDAGFQTFKNSLAGRAGRIYVGANDGMLHAFNASNGQEVWAFVPTPVIPNLWKLADQDYATSHKNFVNGDPIIGEICVAACTSDSAVWKTILVAGLSGGGRGYYALDITNPDSPSLLWEYTAQQNSNLGYSFGSPVITKLNDNLNTWVVLISTGYNNGSKDNDGVTANNPVGNGVGSLIVLNASTGDPVRIMSTGVGTPTTPSGLSPINIFVENISKNNIATYAYGGDLLGNLWRFDINTGSVVNIATLKGPNGLSQPITTIPELTKINKKRVLLVGTGKYLELADLTNTERQSLYAIKDDDITSSLGNPRGALIAQTIQQNGDSRVASTAAVDFNTSLGWLVDFPDAGERMNIDPALRNGVLVAPTIVPQSSSCSPGGYGWFNYFDYKTGGGLNVTGNVVSEKLNSPAVGYNFVYSPDGRITTTVVEADNPTPHLLQNPDPLNENESGARETIMNKNENGTYGRKYIWRELTPPNN
jgi:type IV pilus assembly protein PilY1